MSQYVEQQAWFDLHYGGQPPTIKQLRSALTRLLKVAPVDARIEVERYQSRQNNTYTRIVARWSVYV